VKSRFYSRAKSSLAVFLAILILFSFSLLNLRLGEASLNRYLVYSVHFTHYGVDAAEIEKTITVPLEEKLTAFPGLAQLMSSSEYGESVTTAYFNRNINEKNTYLALRDIVDNLYVKLPRSVQKPRIYSSAMNDEAVMSVSANASSMDVDKLRFYVEHNIKEKLQAVDGVSEVIVSGGHIEEFRVQFDSDKLASGGIRAEALALVVQDANVIMPSARIRKAASGENFAFNTRLSKIEDMGALPVKVTDDIITRLEYLSKIERKPRAQEEIVRVNGNEAVAVHIKSSSRGNCMEISDKCRSILSQYDSTHSGKDIEFKILRDKGEFIKKLLRSLFVSIGISFLLVILIIPFFYSGFFNIILLILLIVSTFFWSFSTLSFLGVFVDSSVLSGASIAVGLIIDSSLVITGLAAKQRGKTIFFNEVRGAALSLFASNITTLIVLVPLYFLEYIIPGIKSVVITIAVMICSSFIISIVFYPCFVYRDAPGISVIPEKIIKKLKRLYLKFSYFAVSTSLRFEKISVSIYAALMLLAVFIFIVSGKNITMVTSDNIMYAYIEYESAMAPFAVENNSYETVKAIQGFSGVNFVSTEAKKGVMEMEIGFNPHVISRAALARQIEALSAYLPKGFLYVPDLKKHDKKEALELEIAVIGDDSATCREIARAAAAALSNMGGLEQVVLNFKEDADVARFIPDRDLLSKNGITVYNASATLRQILFGPVIDKWIQDGEEMDIRLTGNNDKEWNFEDLSNIYISTSSGGVRLASLGTLEKAPGIGKIYRKDGRRAAYLTAHINSDSTDKTIREARRALSGVRLPAGYGFSFPRDLEKLQEHYSVLALASAASFILILIFLTAVTESFIKALLICSIIPVSLSLPFLLVFITNHALTMSDIVGMVIISGISVNNTIYIAESKKSRIQFMVRDKIQSLLVTSATTIAGAAPLYFAAGNEFSKSLSFFIFWGALCSALAVLFLFPALFRRAGICLAMGVGKPQKL